MSDTATISTDEVVAKDIDQIITNTDKDENIDTDDIPCVGDGSVIDEVNTSTSEDSVSAINQLMLTTLSPQLSENEKQKRIFKQKLMKYIQVILVSQLSVVGLAFIAIVACICLGVSHPIFADNIQAILNFMQYYITAIIVEFIAMLFFIVKFVFDKSIVELLSDTIKKQ